MKAFFSFLFQLFSFSFWFGQGVRQSRPAATTTFNDSASTPTNRSSESREKRYGSLELYSQKPLVNSREERDRRTQHRRIMKGPKRVLRMARRAPWSVSKNARRVAVTKHQKMCA